MADKQNTTKIGRNLEKCKRARRGDGSKRPIKPGSNRPQRTFSARAWVPMSPPAVVELVEVGIQRTAQSSFLTLVPANWVR